jgi:tetratricopeptide (TPR) repeat protein
MVYANRALIQRPNDAEPHVILARFYFAKEMPGEARLHLSAALASRDSSPEAHYCLGRYFLDLGDYYQSRDYFERCLQADPNFYVALRDLQCCYYELGDFAQGIEACERLLESDPTDAGSYYNLGLLYQRLGRTHLARKFFEEAIRQDPAFYKASFMIAEYHYGRGEYDLALARYEESNRIVPDSPETLGRLGDCLYQLGRVSDAYRHYVRARNEDPLFENARHHLIEGQTLAGDGDLEGARQRFLRATEVHENLAEAWNELGGVLLRMGKPEEALTVVRRGAEIEADHPALLANLLVCCRRLPLGLRLSGWVRKLARETNERLRYLQSEGIVPPPAAKRRFRRLLGSLTWYSLRG